MPANSPQVTVMGIAGDVDPQIHDPVVHGPDPRQKRDVVKAFISDTTYFSALQNLDRLDRDRIPDPAIDPIQKDTSPPGRKAEEVRGPRPSHRRQGDLPGPRRPRVVQRQDLHVLHSHIGYLMFEHTHWWITRICAMGDKSFDDLFHEFPISLHVFEQFPITLDAKFALSLQTFFVSNSSSLMGCVTEPFRTSWYEVQAGRCSPWQGRDRLLGSVNYHFPEE